MEYNNQLEPLPVLENQELLKITFMILNFMIGAAYNQDKWGVFFGIQKQNPADKYIILCANQLIFCLMTGLKQEASKETVEQILETGLRNGTFDAKTIEGVVYYKFNIPGEIRGVF
jgi:hypothetical protein